MAENDNNNENNNQSLGDKAKDKLNEKKGQAKSQIKQQVAKRLIAMLPGILPIILIIILAIFLVGIWSAVGETVTNILGGIVDGIVDFFTVNEEDGAIVVTNEQIDTIINGIYETGVNPADLHLLGDVEGVYDASTPEYQEALRKYVREFYEAQAVTETLNYFHTPSNDLATYGAIYMFRTTNNDTNGDGTVDNNDRIQMEYISYEQMLEMQEDGNTEIWRYFSIDDADNLIISSSVIKKVESGSSVDNLTETSDGSEVTITLRQIDYKAAVAQYTTQMNFLLDLTMISQNPEFVSAVVDLIVNTRIELTVMDNTTTTETTNIYQYQLYTTNGIDIFEPQDFTEVTKTTVFSTDPSVNITYVKTWFCEQTITYVEKENTVEETNTTSLGSESMPTGGSAGSWKVNQTSTVINKVTTETFEESVRGDVIITLGERGDGERYANGEITSPTFVGLMETEFKIPNSTRMAEAGTNLVSGAEMLFYLLQQDPKLETMETIMRYALYLYSGRDYGVTSIDGSIFEASDNFYQIIGGSVTNGGSTSIGGGYGSGSGEYWWPVGSSTIETINGVEYASGAPASTTINSAYGEPRYDEEHGGIDLGGSRRNEHNCIKRWSCCISSGSIWRWIYRLWRK